MTRRPTRWWPWYTEVAAAASRSIGCSPTSRARRHRAPFILGFILGAASAFIVFLTTEEGRPSSSFLYFFGYLTGAGNVFRVGALGGSSSSVIKSPLVSYEDAAYDFAYERWLRQTRGMASVTIDPDLGRYEKRRTQERENSNDARILTEAEFLSAEVPVVCLVLNPDSPEFVQAVSGTWGQHCNDLFFFYAPSRVSSSFAAFNSSKRSMSRPKALWPVPEASSEFGLLCRAFLILKKLFNKGRLSSKKKPWVMVAPYDSYVLPENLRYFLAPMRGDRPLYLGHALRFWGVTYNWGPAGFALNWEAVSNLLGRKFPTASDCDKGGKFWKNGDWYLGKHLADLAIKPADTRDHAGRGRFNGYSMKKLLFPGAVSPFERFWKDSVYQVSDGPGCCSNYAVTFAGTLTKTKLYQEEYLHYHLRPFYGGGSLGNRPPNDSYSRISPEPVLTWDEYLKNKALDNMFNPVITTPKELADMLKSLG